MPVQYNIVQRVKPGDPAAPRKFYAVAQTTGETSLRELAEHISQISTVSSIDTLAVLESLITVLPRYLLNGKIVRLSDLGSFRLSISSDGADTEADFSKALIKDVRLLFRPGSLIANSLKTVEYSKKNGQ